MRKYLGFGVLLAAGCEFPRPANVDSGYTLTVAKQGDGAALGTVTSTPVGIACGDDCVEAFAEPTAVTLAATAGAGASFVGWSGEGCAGTGTCVVTVDAMRAVTAEFDARVALTVTRAGAGDGTVTGAGIDCGTDCTEDVAVGAMVELVATPAAGEVFFGWSGGGCAGTGSCTVTVTAATTVTATFDECVRGAVTCSAASGLYTACGADGAYVRHLIPNGGAGGTPATIEMRDYTCPMGCHASEPRCLDVSASNGLNAALDAAATSPGGLDLAVAEAGETILDTGVFDATAGTTVLTPPSGTPVTVPARVITQSGAPDILVLEVRTFTIAAGATLVVRGTRALGVASHFDVYIAGHLKASGAVGGAGQSLYGPCHGVSSGVATGGGGNLHTAGRSSTASLGGVAQAVAMLSPLDGGCGGGAITSAGGPPRSRGGGGIELVSRTKIVLDGGLLNVSGRAGYASIDPTDTTAWATGGGSGGNVVLEAPGIGFLNGSSINGRGGSGGAALQSPPTVAVGRDGDEASNDGAMCSGCGVGGRGGTETATPGSGTGTAPALGGGGGSVGKCIMRTRAGSVGLPPGALKIFLVATQTLPTR